MPSSSAREAVNSREGAMFFLDGAKDIGSGGDFIWRF